MQPRLLQLHPKTVQRLKNEQRAAERDGAYRVATRVHAVLLNHAGSTSGEIARLLHRPRSRVAAWLKHYAEGGYEALLEGQRTGRPAGLDEKQKQQLADIIDSGPVAYGFTCGVWSSILINQVIHEEFSLAYHPAHVRKILHQLGFSVQRPKRVLARADPQAQHRWIRYTYPHLKKK